MMPFVAPLGRAKRKASRTYSPPCGRRRHSRRFASVSDAELSYPASESSTSSGTESVCCLRRQLASETKQASSFGRRLTRGRDGRDESDLKPSAPPAIGDRHRRGSRRLRPREGEGRAGVQSSMRV